MNTLRWALILTLPLLATLAPVGIDAQEADDAEEIVRAFFAGKNYLAPGIASVTCPGEDASNDAIVEAFLRPRPREEIIQLERDWGYMPECRANQMLGWYEDQVIPVIPTESAARSAARQMLTMDTTATIRLLRRAAADPSIPDGARGGYQTFVYFRLGAAEQVDLYIETFEQELQAGLYPNVSLAQLVMRPNGPDTALRLLSAVLQYPENAQASHILGVVLSVAANPKTKSYRPADRQRIWDFLEPRLGSMPPHWRDAIESYEERLTAGPG